MNFEKELTEIEKMQVSIEIERIYHECSDTNYLEACLEFAEKNKVDIEDIPKIISKPLLDNIRQESLEHNLLKEDRPNEISLEQWL